MATRFDGDVICGGTLSANTINYPAGGINDAAVAAGAAIAANKVIHQFALHVEVDPATTVAALTKLLHTVQGSTAKVTAIDVVTTTPPSGDHTVSVDLQKGNASTAFASILGAAVGLSSTTAARTPVEGAVTSPTLADDDTLQIVITVAGSTGSQAQGLLVTVTLSESPT